MGISVEIQLESPTDRFEAVRSDTSRSGPAGHQLADMARPINYTPGSEPYTLPKLFERRLSLFFGEIRRIPSDFLDSWDFRILLFFTLPSAGTLFVLTVANSIQLLPTCRPCPRPAWQPGRARIVRNSRPAGGGTLYV